MIVFSGVAPQCEERGGSPAGADFEVADPPRSGRDAHSAEAEFRWFMRWPSPQFELTAIGPDAVEDDSNFVGVRRRGLSWGLRV